MSSNASIVQGMNKRNTFAVGNSMSKRIRRGKNVGDMYELLDINIVGNGVGRR